jgi:hypothetical protein
MLNIFNKINIMDQSLTSKVAELNRFIKPVFLFTILIILSCCTQHSTKLNVAGKWQVKITVAEGTIQGSGSFKQVGDSVTGWVGASERDPIDIKGILKTDTLTLKTFPRPGRTVAFDKVDLEIRADSMVGKIEHGSHGQGTIKFFRLK